MTASSKPPAPRGADEDETAFKEKLAVIARQKVKPATDPADDKP